MEVRDKVVIITGASSGIGLATTKLLAKKGAKVVLVARSKDKLKNLQLRSCWSTYCYATSYSTDEETRRRNDYKH